MAQALPTESGERRDAALLLQCPTEQLLNKFVAPHVIHDWRGFGISLGVSANAVETIHKEEKDSRYACIRMFTQWLRDGAHKQGGGCTWKELLEAVSDSPGPGVSNEIERKLTEHLALVQAQQQSEPPQSIHLRTPGNEVAIKDLDVDGLYQVLEKDLGADIATVIRDQEVLGQDYLGLTEADVSKLFPKMGQAKKVLRHIQSISDLTAETSSLCSCIEQYEKTIKDDKTEPKKPLRRRISTPSPTVPHTPASRPLLYEQDDATRSMTTEDDKTGPKMLLRRRMSTPSPTVPHTRASCPLLYKQDDTKRIMSEPPQSIHLRTPRNEVAFKDLNVDGLYQVLKKDLGADIATVIRDQEVLGQDYLGLTEADVSKLFPKMGQAKKVLRHIKSISDLTAENENTTEGDKTEPKKPLRRCISTPSPTVPHTRASRPLVYEQDDAKRSMHYSSLQMQMRRMSTPSSTVPHTPASHPLLYKQDDTIRSMSEPHQPIHLRTPGNEVAFKDLDVDGLYQVLEKDLGVEIATVIRDQEVLGQDYLGLKEVDVSKLFPKMGQAKKVLRHIQSISDLTAEDSQTKPKGQGQHRTIPKSEEPPLQPERLALQVKETSVCIIESFSQSIYELELTPVMADKAKGVAKYQFGKPCPGSKEYVVMLVGATGAGKTTLINGVANYILGVEWEDNFRFKLITEEGSGNQAESQTTCITAYTIHKQEGSRFHHTLTIVDTPGFGDTKGLEFDKRLVAQIKHFFSIKGKKGIDHIHGIGFVAQASLARLTPPQRYVFDSILSIYGKDIGSNILLMTTFADGKTQPVLAAVKAARIGFHRSFKFNNSAIFTDEVSDEEGPSFEQMFWKMGMASFDRFFTELVKMPVKSLVLTKEVLEERENLESIMKSLPQQIQGILGKINSLRAEERAIEQHEADIKANRNFTFTVKEPRMEQVNIAGTGRYVTNCMKCNFTCHDDCVFADDEDKQRCIAMQGTDNCTVCPGKCFWRNHKNNDFYYEVHEVPVRKTYDDIKQRYEKALNGKTSKENIVNMIRKDVVSMYREVSVMIRRAQRILQRLDEIALHPNPLSEVAYIDLLIQSEMVQGKEGYLGRIRVLKDVRSQAVLLADVKDDKIFEDEVLQQAKTLVEREASEKFADEADHEGGKTGFVATLASMWNSLLSHN